MSFAATLILPLYEAPEFASTTELVGSLTTNPFESETLPPETLLIVPIIDFAKRPILINAFCPECAIKVFIALKYPALIIITVAAV